MPGRRVRRCSRSRTCCVPCTLRTQHGDKAVDEARRRIDEACPAQQPTSLPLLTFGGLVLPSSSTGRGRPATFRPQRTPLRHRTTERVLPTDVDNLWMTGENRPFFVDAQRPRGGRRDDDRCTMTVLPPAVPDRGAKYRQFLDSPDPRPPAWIVLLHRIHKRDDYLWRDPSRRSPPPTFARRPLPTRRRAFPTGSGVPSRPGT